MVVAGQMVDAAVAAAVVAQHPPERHTVVDVAALVVAAHAEDMTAKLQLHCQSNVLPQPEALQRQDMALEM